MFKKIIITSMATITLLFGATDSSVDDKTIEFMFIQKTLPKTKITKYKKSIVDGFYDVYLENGQILYVNPYKELIFFGEIMNKNGYNHTASNRAKWQEELNDKLMKKTNADELVKYAKKVVFNKGSQNKYSYVLFTDPQCPYCQNVEEMFAKNNATVYFNFIPLPFHKDAKRLSTLMLSSSDFKKALEDIHKGDEPKATITAKAKEQLKKMQDLGKKLKVTGTPRIYVIDLEKQIIIDMIKGAYLSKIKSYIKEK